MKPPYCEICDKHLEMDEAKLIYFKKRRSDLAWEKRMDRIHGTGHPPHCAWFCAKHYAIASKLEHLTIGKALAIILKKEKK